MERRARIGIGEKELREGRKKVFERKREWREGQAKGLERKKESAQLKREQAAY